MSGGPSPSPSSERATPDLEGPTPVIVRRRNLRGPVVLSLGALFVALMVALVAGTSAGWFGARGTGAGVGGACPTDVALLGEGASFIVPLMSAWEAEFHAASGGDTIEYSPAGAGAGITALTERTVPFAATDEPLTAAQYSALPAPVLTLPISGGALAIVYDLAGLPSPLKLDGSVLAGIYLGTITHWNDPAIAALNPGLSLPASAIVTAHRSDAAGATYVLTDFLSQESPAWAAGPGTGIEPSWPATPREEGVSGNSGLLSYVERTAGAIGYVDLTDVLSSGGVSYARMENPSGAFVLPSLTNTASAIDDALAAHPVPSPSADWSSVSMVNAAGADDYPLAAMTYFLVYQDTGATLTGLGPAQVLVAWLHFAVTVGQNDTPALHYVALPSTLGALDEAAIAKISSGGAPVPGCTLTQ